jgi:hypothetical protein
MTKQYLQIKAAQREYSHVRKIIERAVVKGQFSVRFGGTPHAVIPRTLRQLGLDINLGEGSWSVSW